jgi:hypothetical protein
MNFDWLKSLTDNIELDAPKAWIVTLVGALAFAVIHFAPSWKLDGVVTSGVALFLLLWGIVNLIVGAIRWMLSNYRNSIERDRLNEQELRKQEALISDLQMNIETLKPHELSHLIWILRNNKKRIDQFGIDAGLYHKGLVFYIDSWNSALTEVHPWVWDNRQMLIERFSSHGLYDPFYPGR